MLPVEEEEVDPFEGIDPMDLANEIADMREQMAEHYTSERLMEILCGISSRDQINGALEAELTVFAENFVEKFESKCEPLYDARMEESIAGLLEAVFGNF